MRFGAIGNDWPTVQIKYSQFRRPCSEWQQSPSEAMWNLCGNPGACWRQMAEVGSLLEAAGWRCGPNFPKAG